MKPLAILSLLLAACGGEATPLATTITMKNPVTASQVKAYRLSVLPKLDRDRREVTCERFFCGVLTNVPLLAEGAFAFDATVVANHELGKIAPQKDLLIVAEAFDAVFAADGTNPGALVGQGCTFGVEVRAKSATEVLLELRDPLTDAQKGTLCQP